MFKNVHFKKYVIAIIIIIVVILCLFLALNYIFRNLIYKREYKDIVENISKKYEINPNLIYSVIKTESNFNKDAVSIKKAKGLMQVLESTAKEMVSKSKDIISENIDLHDPETNINVGVKYLKILIDKYDGNYLFALAAYNGGMGNVDKWIKDGIISINNNESLEQIPFPETKKYVKKVAKLYEIYNSLYK